MIKKDNFWSKIQQWFNPSKMGEEPIDPISDKPNGTMPTANEKMLQAALETAQNQIKTLTTAAQVTENQQVTIQKEKDALEKKCADLQKKMSDNKKYFEALDNRYGDFLKIARQTDESDPEQIKRLWHIVIAMSFHHYDYMKMFCNDVNWRKEQQSNIQLILNRLNSVNDLPADSVIPYSDDPREIEMHFRVLRRLLKQVDIEKLDDVLMSGVQLN
jgi:chromosome segregation ATPase